MALVDCGTFWMGDPPAMGCSSTGDGAASFQLNAAGQRFGCTFTLRKSGTIDHLGVRISTCATPQTMRVGLYTVDANGFPTTTLYGSSNYETFTPTANTMFDKTLSSPATATAGDDVALVVEFDSTGGDLFVTCNATNADSTAWPMLSKYSSGAWAKATKQFPFGGFIRYSDGSYPRTGMMPFLGALVAANVNSGSATTDEYALRFTPTAPLRLCGAWTGTSQGGTSATYDLCLYDGTTLLTSQSILPVPLSNLLMADFYFGSPQVLTPGTTYYLSVKPTSANNITFRSTNIVSGTAEAVGWPSAWAAALATRVDLGSWSPDTARLPALGPIFDQIDDGAGSGGGLVAAYSSQILQHSPFRAVAY